jgi:hypothetical protein
MGGGGGAGGESGGSLPFFEGDDFGFFKALFGGSTCFLAFSFSFSLSFALSFPLSFPLLLLSFFSFDDPFPRLDLDCDPE